LIALDEKTGNVLWENFNSAFDHLTINGPALYDTHFQPKKLSVADIRTGGILRGYEPSIDLELNTEIRFPELVSPELLLPFHLPVHALENTIYYLEHYNWRIVSLHAIIDGALQQHLYLAKETETIYHDLLNDGIQKLQPESFLVYKDQLICLKNHSQLKVFNL
jgi:hypothetical protein